MKFFCGFDLHYFKLMILNTFSCTCWPVVWLLLRNVNNLRTLEITLPTSENYVHLLKIIIMFFTKGFFFVALLSEISSMKTIQFYFVWFPNSKLYLKYSFKLATPDSLEILSALHTHLQPGQSWEHSPD